MTLSGEARERLADVVRLQPTKNAELQERWDMDSGSEVHGYLEGELSEYYYRDEDSYIRATDEAADLVDVEPGTREDDDGTTHVRTSRLGERVLAVLAGPDERAQSVVSVLHDLRDAFDVDPSADEVRSTLRELQRKDAVEVVYRTVPTFRRAAGDGDLEVTVDGE